MRNIKFVRGRKTKTISIAEKDGGLIYEENTVKRRKRDLELYKERSQVLT